MDTAVNTIKTTVHDLNNELVALIGYITLARMSGSGEIDLDGLQRTADRALTAGRVLARAASELIARAA